MSEHDVSADPCSVRVEWIFLILVAFLWAGLTGCGPATPPWIKSVSIGSSVSDLDRHLRARQLLKSTYVIIHPADYPPGSKRSKELGVSVDSWAKFQGDQDAMLNDVLFPYAQWKERGLESATFSGKVSVEFEWSFIFIDGQLQSIVREYPVTFD